MIGRQRVMWCVLLSLCGSIAVSASAQTYPVKPVRIVVASSAGSNPDTVARVLADGLTRIWGQQVIVDDRAGAGGNIGAEIAARAPADGYTVFLAHTNHGVNTALYQKLSYDLLRDFSAVTMLANSAFVAAAHPALPVKSVPDLIRLAKARPGDLTYASAGTGSGTHFAAEYFMRMAKIQVLHVAYKGGGPALSAVLGGETMVYFTPYATGVPHFRGGKLRPLGVTAPQPLRDLPDVPAIGAFLPGYELMAWAGFMVPSKVPKEIVETLNKSALAALARPDVSKRLDDLGFLPIGSRPDEMSAYIKAEIDKYAQLIRQIGLPRE